MTGIEFTQYRIRGAGRDGRDLATDDRSKAVEAWKAGTPVATRRVIEYAGGRTYPVTGWRWFGEIREGAVDGIHSG